VAEEPGGFRVSGGGRYYSEEPEGVSLSAWRVETMVRRFLDARERKVAWQWIGVFLATAPVVLSDSFTVTIGPVGPRVWTVLLGVVAAFSGLKVVTGGTSAIAWWLYEHDVNLPTWTRTFFVTRPDDWCSTNVTTFVKGLVRDVEAEDKSRRERQVPAAAKTDPGTFDPDEIPF